MRVRNVKAESNARGGQIDLTWTNPTRVEFPDFKGVKILRRELTFPDAEEIKNQRGIYLDTETKAGESGRFSDTNLQSETTYYYAIVTFDNQAEPDYNPVFVTAMTTAAYGLAAQLYDGLPALYQRYDTTRPPLVPQLDPQDLDKGQLRRFMEMFGAQFDLLRSYASGMRNFFDVERVDGALLPLFAQWLGWQTDYTLPIGKQRNEIKYAPHFYRTTGIAANLRATLNRLTTWDAQIKEFIHNIFISNNPEQLTIWETSRRNNVWEAAQPVTVDVAYEGKPAAIYENEKQQWLFYHARYSDPATHASQGHSSATGESFHLWYKLCQQGEWLPAHRITFHHAINKYPAVVQRKSDGNFWVFYSQVEKGAGEHLPQVKLMLLAAGRPAQPARIEGSKPEPFALTEGDQFKITINDGRTAYAKTITFHQENFRDISRATAAEVVAFLHRELAGVEAHRASDRSLVLTSLLAGDSASITLDGGAAATKLGLLTSSAGLDAKAAQLTGSSTEPFALEDGDTLSIKVDGRLPVVITFKQKYFNHIGRATAAEVAAVIRRFIPGLAQAFNKQVKLSTLTTGASSHIAIDVDASTAAPKLGFGVLLPSAMPQAADSEPAAFEDQRGGVWLFWSSRRDENRWKIWYNRFDGTRWGAARPLTAGPVADRQPSVVFDPATNGKMWVFWSRRKEIGRWNICYRTASNAKDFDTLAETDWTERELGRDPQGEYDNQEPAALLVDSDHVELFFSSNRANGMHLWSSVVSLTAQARGVPITTGQFTSRAPAVLKLSDQTVRLWFRSNESQTYESQLYPASRTVDARYSGSTLLDTGNPAKYGVQGAIQDILHYTYDTKKGNENWYARDTVGIYLTPDTNDEALIVRKREQIASLLGKYLPIQVRAVLIIQQVFPEIIYTYDRPEVRPPYLIGERAFDTLTGEAYQGVADGYRDRASFHWLRTWTREQPGGLMPDLKTHPPDLTSRLPLSEVEEGE